MDFIISKNKFFIKKVWFPGEDDTICELISVNKEINETVEVIASMLKEYKQQTDEYLDIKKYISEEEAELLLDLVSNEEAFLERVNNIID
jgi:hypothetical protein